MEVGYFVISETEGFQNKAIFTKNQPVLCIQDIYYKMVKIWSKKLLEKWSYLYRIPTLIFNQLWISRKILRQAPRKSWLFLFYLLIVNPIMALILFYAWNLIFDKITDLENLKILETLRIIFLQISFWKAGRFEKMVSFGNSHPIVTRYSRVTRAPPTPHPFLTYIDNLRICKFFIKCQVQVLSWKNLHKVLKFYWSKQALFMNIAII